MQNQRGFSLVELITVVALASVMFVSAIGYSVPWMAKQTMRAAVHDVRSFMQLTKIEAVSRNRECRFVVDTLAGELQVWDMLGNSDPTDDVLLHDGRVPDSVGFDRPDFGAAVTLQTIDATTFQTVFNSDGTVAAGPGDVFFFSAESFGRIGVHAAGGTTISYWNGSAWQVGS